MNRFKQRIPAFIDSRGITRVNFDFNTVEELTSHPFIQRWLSHYPDSVLSKTTGTTLLVVSNEGFTWRAIGWIDDPESLDLPVWRGGKHIVRYADGTTEALTPESDPKVAVVRSGGEATLSNGAKCSIIEYNDWIKDNAQKI
jgi:hypothetical protein